MSMGKIVALMAATSAVAFTAATIGTKVVISKLNLKNKKNSIDLGEVTQSQKCGSEQSGGQTDRSSVSGAGNSPHEKYENGKIVDFKGFTDDVLYAMIDTFEKKMPYSEGHSKRVADISKAIGVKMGYKDLDGLYYAALLHDIGKIYMAGELLNKSKLSMTESEKELWHNHPKTGASIVKSISEISDYAEDIKHHHERFDGSGYPDGLVGEDIPLGSRIIAVADAYEAMSSERPGREAYPREYIISELSKCSGKQFDPAVAKAMMAVIADIETK